MDLFWIPARDRGGGVATILWIIAAIFVIGGIVTLIRGAVLYGIVVVIIGRLIGGGRRHPIPRFRPEEEGPGGTRSEFVHVLPVRPGPM
jgi:hypothetical protein